MNLKYGVGKVKDHRCRGNSIKPINRKVCRNNCKQWSNNKCSLGYGVMK